MKKHIKNYSLLALLIITLFARCEKDEATFTEPNHRVILTSEMDFGNKINPNEDMTFGDVSSGVVSRTWTFPDNVVDVLRSDNDKTSSKKTVEVIFNTPGDYNVTLNQVFKDAPYSQTNVSQAPTSILDTTIVIRVLPEVKINLVGNFLNDDGTLGAPLNISEKALNEVVASKKVRFSYTVAGEPEDYNWTFGTAGVDPKTFDGSDAEIDVKYKSLGNYDLKFIASRSRPGGADTIHLKEIIKVIPSTDPVFLDAVNENNGKIDLEFSRDMDPDSFNNATFIVSLENDGNAIPVQITNAAIKAGENNIITITLNETVYADDITKVSYTPGTLKTSDQVNATAFTDQLVLFGNLENILKNTEFDYSFENRDASSWPYQWWGGIWGEYDFAINSDKPAEGNNSAYIEYRAGGGMIIGHKDALGNGATIPLKKGQTYEVGVWVYVTEPFASSPYPISGNLFASDIRMYDLGFSFEIVPVTFDENFPIGEWVYRKNFFTAPTDMDAEMLIRGYNEGTDKVLKFYLDNFSFKEVTLRP